MADNIAPNRKMELLEFLLWPFVKMCVRRCFSFQEVLSVLKALFVKAGIEEISRSGKKINVSRISVCTGMHRAEVLRLFNELKKGNIVPPEPQSLSVIGRVIGQWRDDKRFTTKAGDPRILDFLGETSDFRKLANSVSTAVHSGTILSELKRMGAVEVTPKGLKLVLTGSSVDGDEMRSTELLSQELSTLIQSSHENIYEQGQVPNLHIRTEYNNLYLDSIPQIRNWLLDEGRAFHRRARDFLSQHDKDISPRKDMSAPTGGRVVISAFSITEPVSPSDSSSEQKSAKKS